jgi:hypothetical protein
MTTISDQLFSYVQNLQVEADRSFSQYPKNTAVLPNDAIALLRDVQLRGACDLIQQMVDESGQSLADVIKFAIAPGRNDFVRAFPHTGPALDAIIERYGARQQL